MVPSRSSVVHWMLEEIGEPFDLHVLNMRKGGETGNRDYLAINPIGKVRGTCRGILCALAALISADQAVADAPGWTTHVLVRSRSRA